MNENQNEKSPSNRTWGDRIKSSLIIGFSVSALWIVIMLATGRYNLSISGDQGAENMSGLLGNALGIFFIVFFSAFIVKVIFYFFKKLKE